MNQYVWPNWQRQKNAEHALYMEGVRKALDIPSTPGFNTGGNTNTTVNNSDGGFLKGAAVSLLGPAALGAALWGAGVFDKPKVEPTVVVEPGKTVEKTTKEGWQLGQPTVIPPKE